MFDLLAASYQADITRVATFMMAREASQRTFPVLGIAMPHHDVSHHGNQPAMIENHAKVGRHFTELEPGEQARNLVTTRILWLRGLESGVNAGWDVDSHARYIYIHGTNHEERLGRPASSGCVHFGWSLHRSPAR